METIKQTIKTLASQQAELKNQRKTLNIVGPRTIEPWQATITHKVNRTKLRELYAAYSIIRGKLVQMPKKEILNMSNVTKLVEQYGEAIRSSS